MTNEKRTEKKDNRKRAVAVGLVGLGIAGLAAASAATLTVTAGGTGDTVAGGSANINVVVGGGLDSVNVNLSVEPGSAFAGDPVWNIQDAASDWTLTLDRFNGEDPAPVGEYRIAFFTEPLPGGADGAGMDAPESPIAWADLTLSEAGRTYVEFDEITFAAGVSSLEDVARTAGSVSVVFEAESV